MTYATATKTLNPDSGLLTIENAHFKAEIAPACGGLLSRLVWKHGSDQIDLLRRPQADDADALQPGHIQRHGLWPMVPYANRAFDGKLLWKGKTIALPKEHEPMHGDGWRNAWRVSEHSQDWIRLEFESNGGAGPWNYTAAFDVLLDKRCVVTVHVVNQGAEPLPFGIGLHPWFPRYGKTILQATANAALQLGEGYRPTGSGPVPAHQDWRGAGKPLPEAEEVAAGLVDATPPFRLTYPEKNFALTLGFSPSLRNPVVWSNAGGNYVCIEPQSHPIGAPSEKLVQAVSPMKIIQPEETFSGWMSLEPAAI
jgi:aldose 1-epimerase